MNNKNIIKLRNIIKRLINNNLYNNIKININ